MQIWRSWHTYHQRVTSKGSRTVGSDWPDKCDKTGHGSMTRGGGIFFAWSSSQVNSVGSELVWVTGQFSLWVNVFSVFLPPPFLPHLIWWSIQYRPYRSYWYIYFGLFPCEIHSIFLLSGHLSCKIHSMFCIFQYCFSHNIHILCCVFQNCFPHKIHTIFPIFSRRFSSQDSHNILYTLRLFSPQGSHFISYIFRTVFPTRFTQYFVYFQDPFPTRFTQYFVYFQDCFPHKIHTAYIIKPEKFWEKQKTSLGSAKYKFEVGRI